MKARFHQTAYPSAPSDLAFIGLGLCWPLIIVFPISLFSKCLDDVFFFLSPPPIRCCGGYFFLPGAADELFFLRDGFPAPHPNPFLRDGFPPGGERILLLLLPLLSKVLFPLSRISFLMGVKGSFLLP